MANSVGTKFKMAENGSNKEGAKTNANLLLELEIAKANRLAAEANERAAEENQLAAEANERAAEKNRLAEEAKQRTAEATVKAQLQSLSKPLGEQAAQPVSPVAANQHVAEGEK